LVAIAPIVVCSGAANRSSTRPPAKAFAESTSRRLSGASRAPATSAPVLGSRTSPTAFTTTTAPTTSSPSRREALPRPPRIARPMRCTLPTLAPVPAPTLPSANGPAAALAAASMPISRVGRARPSPTLRSKMNAPGTCGTTVGPAAKPPGGDFSRQLERALRQRPHERVVRQRELALGENRRGGGRDRGVLAPVGRVEDPGHLGEAAAPAAACLGGELALDHARQDRFLPLGLDLIGDHESALARFLNLEGVALNRLRVEATGGHLGKAEELVRGVGGRRAGGRQ